MRYVAHLVATKPKDFDVTSILLCKLTVALRTYIVVERSSVTACIEEANSAVAVSVGLAQNGGVCDVQKEVTQSSQNSQVILIACLNLNYEEVASGPSTWCSFCSDEFSTQAEIAYA